MPRSSRAAPREICSAVSGGSPGGRTSSNRRVAASMRSSNRRARLLTRIATVAPSPSPSARRCASASGRRGTAPAPRDNARVIAAILRDDPKPPYYRASGSPRSQKPELAGRVDQPPGQPACGRAAHEQPIDRRRIAELVDDDRQFREHRLGAPARPEFPRVQIDPASLLQQRPRLRAGNLDDRPAGGQVQDRRMPSRDRPPQAADQIRRDTARRP